MSDKVTKIVNLASKVSAFVIQEVSPRWPKFKKYALVELRPPNQADLKPALEQAWKLIDAGKNGAWKNVTLKEGLVNAAVTAEVLCWFFIGEIIGRRSFLGYSRVPHAYIKHH
uniref:ATP synthase subunit g n=1 Tax=Schistosoma japonicum TaxID=6182 RepID=C1LRK5_SCHJA|nr:lethal (2) 06225 [Schistosoma japonicum]